MWVSSGLLRIGKAAQEEQHDWSQPLWLTSGAANCASCLLESVQRETRPRIPHGLLVSPEVVILGENIRLHPGTSKHSFKHSVTVSRCSIAVKNLKPVTTL